ncbi:MAG TPA: hypothetical protein VFO65_08775 [Acidimicrobiales bacterium]|nr:hypothetical protein [Acidimicrobiales bacterium]
MLVARQPSRKVIAASARKGPLARAVPIRRFHRASPNITAAVAARKAMPAGEDPGRWPSAIWRTPATSR